MLTKPSDDLLELEQHAEAAARLLKLLANDRRLLILCRLIGEREMTVTTIADAVGLGQSALSQHLARMREEGLVTYRREGTTLYYRIEDPKVGRVIALLQELYCPPKAS